MWKICMASVSASWIPTLLNLTGNSLMMINFHIEANSDPDCREYFEWIKFCVVSVTDRALNCTDCHLHSSFFDFLFHSNCGAQTWNFDLQAHARFPFYRTEFHFQLTSSENVWIEKRSDSFSPANDAMVWPHNEIAVRKTFWNFGADTVARKRDIESKAREQRERAIKYETRWIEWVKNPRVWIEKVVRAMWRTLQSNKFHSCATRTCRIRAAHSLEWNEM